MDKMLNDVAKNLIKDCVANKTKTDLKKTKQEIEYWIGLLGKGEDRPEIVFRINTTSIDAVRGYALSEGFAFTYEKEGLFTKVTISIVN